MAFQPWPNYQGPWIGMWPGMGQPTPASVSSLQTMDAASEGGAFIGRIYLTSGPGTSKTLSSAGGKIYWRNGGSTTFANAGTTIKTGIQGLTSGGLPDGVWGPYGEYVGGTDTLTNNTVNVQAIESGSQSITHGDRVCIVVYMTARGGADSVIIQTASNIGNFMGNSYTANESGGAGFAKVTSSNLASAYIEFDDGTMGAMQFDAIIQNAVTSTNVNTGSTPDEYAMGFQVPVPIRIGALWAYASPSGTSATFDIVLYSDPFGTPVAERTVSIDPNYMSTTGADKYVEMPLTSAFDLTASTDYAIAVLPTSANNVGIRRATLPSANTRKIFPLGTTMQGYTRSNVTGAFGSGSTTLIPFVGFRAMGFSDGAGVGGGLLRHPGLRGGLH